jgi:hypothetical protein
MAMKGGSMRRILSGGPVSPVDFIAVAGIIAAALLIMHAAGLRDYTCVISGTFPQGASRSGMTVALGILYAAAYFAAVVAAPILVLASAIFALLRVVFDEKLPRGDKK